MASADILQYYSNTTTKTEATATQTLPTTTAYVQHCFAQHTSGIQAPEAYILANERKQFKDEASAKSASTEATKTNASTEISSLLSSHRQPSLTVVEYSSIQCELGTKHQNTGTTNEKQHSKSDQILRKSLQQSPPQLHLQSLQRSEKGYHFIASPSIWKTTAARKQPNSSEAKSLLPQNQKYCKGKDDIENHRFVEGLQRGRSKSECSAHCSGYSEIPGERPQKQKQQRMHQRCHSESRRRKIKGFANMSNAAATGSELQRQQKDYIQQQISIVGNGDIASSVAAGACKLCRGGCEHITQQTQNNKNKSKTKSYQSGKTKCKKKYNVDACCQAASGCGCYCNPSDAFSCLRQSSRNVNDNKQQKQLQHASQSNDSKAHFSQLFAGSYCSYNATPQLSKQIEASTTIPLLLQPTTVACATVEQRSIFHYKNHHSICSCNRCAVGELCDGVASAAAGFVNGVAATTTTKPFLSTMRCSMRTKFTVALADLQSFSRALFSLIIIFNMLPLFYAECDQTFVSRIGGPQNGTFSAPLLHNHKNHSRQCLYTFLAGPGQRVEVLFTSFNLRGSPPDGSAVGELPACVHEYMDIYSEVQSSDPAELINSPFGGRYCGTIPPRRRISMYRAIAISFFTNKNVSTPDLFEGTYRFINASEYEIGIPIAGSPCSYTITPSMSINKTGALISPTYPGAYPKDMSCTYQFLGESNQRVRLEFRDFDLFFGGPHCPFDYVKVYDGPDNSSALIGTYCGQQRNLVLYSSESSLFVHFYTLPRTANTQNRGFKGIYEFSESFVKLDFIRENDGIHIRGSECDQKILSRKESTGFVLSPNYPYPYIPKTVCRYFIYGMQDAQHLERVRLEFSAFNIPKVEHKDKSESNCTDGYLKIYLKGQETADAYDKFDYELCGNETQRVLSDGPRLAMVFSSGELQGRGFKGKYTFETEYKIPGTAAPDGTCSFTYVSNSKKRGEFNSPRYPSNYPSDTNCSYLFLGEPNEQVTIVFDHFKIKADGNSNATAGAYGSGACFEDWLEMYVVYRDNNDRFLGRYCGLTAPGPVESPRGAVGLRITLHTDQENVASGFKARYFFETPRSDVGECGGNFSNQDSGIITSPNYPAGYKAPGRGMASMACNWIMTARPGYKLSINFEHFSIEGDPASRGCPAAVLRLWLNIDSDQPPMELCGEKTLIEQWYHISTGQTVRISFTTSDKTVGAPGFRIVWTEIQDYKTGPPSTGLLCESTYHFQCEEGYCISDKLRCDGVKNCSPGDDSDELHCESRRKYTSDAIINTTYWFSNWCDSIFTILSSFICYDRK
ncbi:PREDICTED: uncharacterized protein LOC108363453 isoform X1 [Rhagoletis zephyria]|uniref:uncharacterized protein LOC108363453 isoform X1 n=2 Tax=Rhagoletis zephyria TaxID=28612 RepID=UPI00081134F9|nr:PREDICTED: uncharacterized protein LOC108363453 isoform X1 [Rhagoletis zephyria]